MRNAFEGACWMKRYFFLTLSFLPPLFWLVLMFFLSGQNGEETAELSFGIAEWLQQHLFTQLDDRTIHMSLRKSVHIFVYAVEALLLMMPMAKYMSLKRSLLLVLVVCSGIAMLDEVLKAYVPGRHCDWSEILLNILGAFIGVLIGTLIFQKNYKP